MVNKNTRLIDLSVADIEAIIENKIKEVVQTLLISKNQKKEFYSPKEFCDLTGQKYSTVLSKCISGLIKARQDAPGCCWQIHSSAIERYRKEATEIENE